MHPSTKLITCAVLLALFTAGKTNGDELNSCYVGIFSPLPDFNTELMTRDQCELQFTANCGVRISVGNSFACAQNQGLAINCSENATNEEVRKLALTLSLPPMKAVSVSLNDGPQITFDNLAPVREQTVVFHLRNCLSPRATKKLAQMRLPYLLEFGVHGCRSLDVRRADFWSSSKLRLIQFVNSTLESLEVGTFADLPGLRLLSLERGSSQMELFPEDVQMYLMKLHCGREFEPFRRWWRVSGLLRQATEGSVYRIEYDSWKNEELSKNDVFLPIDCAVTPFPNGTVAVDFTMEVFSANAGLPLEGLRDRSVNWTEIVDEFPTFSSEPVTETECQILSIIGCFSLERELYNCKNFKFMSETCWNPSQPSSSESAKREIRGMAIGMARQRLRPTSLTIIQWWNVTSADVAPVRLSIVNLDVSGCSSRATQTAADLRVSNLLYFGIWECSDLVVQRSDFQRIPKLRQLVLANTTMRSLEFDAFGDLPDLRLLIPEAEFYYHGVEEQRFRTRISDYLWRLHCGCDFAWFRQWWANNTRLLHGAQVNAGEVWAYPDTVRSLPYSREDMFLPIDCAEPVPRDAESINIAETAFSRHAQSCNAH